MKRSKENRKALQTLEKAELGSAVAIWWGDAYSTDGWRDGADAIEDVDDLLQVISLGILMKVGEENVLIAGNYQPTGKVSCTMTIPKAWILGAEVYG